MGTTTALSNILGPDGNVIGAGGGGGGGGGGTEDIVLGSLMKPMKGLHVIDATNGPITGDTLIQSGAPSTTGRTLYPWNAGCYNTQSQYWAAAPDGTGFNDSGMSACVNNLGARVYGSTSMDGYPLESNIDFGFITEALSVTVVYFNYGGATGNGYHDNQIYVEDTATGNLKKMTQMPATKTATGLQYRTISFKEAREREFRVMLAMNSWFVGVYIESPYTIRKSANKLMFCVNGDSWNEPWGSVLATPVGGAYPTGTYRVAYTPQMLAEATGAAVANAAQSGTGYFNAGSGASKEEVDIYNQGTFNNCSVFFGKSRIDNIIGKIGPRNPIFFTIGGWNDGAITGSQSAYATRVASGISRIITAKADIQLLFAGIEPVSSAYQTNHQNDNNGIRDAITAAPQANIVGFIDMWDMWLDKTMSGQRGNNVNSSDQIHLHSKGAEMVTRWWTESIKAMTIPAEYYRGMLAYAG